MQVTKSLLILICLGSAQKLICADCCSALLCGLAGVGTSYHRLEDKHSKQHKKIPQLIDSLYLGWALNQETARDRSDLLRRPNVNLLTRFWHFIEQRPSVMDRYKQWKKYKRGVGAAFILGRVRFAERAQNIDVSKRRNSLQHSLALLEYPFCPQYSENQIQNAMARATVYVRVLEDHPELFELCEQGESKNDKSWLNIFRKNEKSKEREKIHNWFFKCELIEYMQGIEETEQNNRSLIRQRRPSLQQAMNHAREIINER